MMNKILLLVVVACMAAAVNAIVCLPNFCDGVRCDNSVTAENCNGVFKPDGGFCGCCPLCVTVISAGGPCFLVVGVPQKSQCIDGTRCVNGTCQTYVASH